MKLAQFLAKPRDERGLSIVLVALLVTAMLAIASIVLDLGQAYANRRQMQNAADAASLAATRALDKAHQAGYASTALNSAVDTTATNVATNNGAQAAQVTCQVIRWNYYLDNTQIIAPCSPASGWISDATNGGPAGVLVGTGVTVRTTFGAVINQKTTTAKANAAATLQPLAAGRGPFIVCGKESNDGYDLLNADGSFNRTKALALGVFPVQAAQLPRCNGPAAFKGKAADPAATFTVPGTDLGDNGNGFDASIQGIVLGATPCQSPAQTDCDLALPIADSTSGYTFHITAIAVFHITGDGHGNPKYFAEYKGNLTTATGGQGGTGVCSTGALCVVKLVS
ncbi:MAG TPA: pilus assembly protein TadG-related protein [Acidimicrobiales bacterium]|jgi:Flp pilus assembly protein TadG|nr:pilus assembly protein TadG-related protein [Acidimicrobiales bacterium]